MKECREYLENLCASVDGEASSEVCREVEKHLEDCPDCRIMVDTLKKTIVLCREGKKIEIPVELASMLAGALKKQWEEKFGNKTED